MPVVPLADPLPQPAPPALVWVFLQLTFFLHLVAMNLLLGGSILALGWRFAGRRADRLLRAALLRRFEKALPVVIAATVTLGVAPLLFVQVLYGRLFFTSSILMGWLWLAIVPLVILAYSGAYLLAGRGERLGSRGAWLATGIAVLLSAVAFLQVTNATRSIRPETFEAAYRADPRGVMLNLGDPAFWPRYLHVLLGAVAVAALAVALLGALRTRSEPELARWAVRRGTIAFAAATAGNVLVGLALLIALPPSVLVPLAGGEERPMAVLVAAILLAVALAGAAVLALGARRPGSATVAVATVLALTLVAMIFLRDEVRRLAFRQAGVEQPSWVVPQWGPFAVFVLCLGLAAVTIGWMARALARGRSAGVQ